MFLKDGTKVDGVLGFITKDKKDIRVAIELKLYKNQDYSNSPVDYCGTRITDTPLKEKLQ
jgi:hypothetical protein